MNLTLLYGAAFTLVLLAARGGRTLRRLLEIALLGALVVTLDALAARLLPGIGAEEVRSRLSTPISYWNNLALVFAFGFVLALGISVRRVAAPRGARRGGGHDAGLPARHPVRAVTRSPGGVARSAPRRRWRWRAGAWSPSGCCWSGSACRSLLMLYANAQRSLRLEHVLQEDHGAARPARGGRAGPGRGRLRRGGAGRPGLVARAFEDRRRRTATGAALAGLAVVGAVVALIVASPAGGPVDWADRQIDSFKTYDPGARSDASTVADRLAVAAGSGRWQNWTVAADEFRDAPWQAPAPGTTASAGLRRGTSTSTSATPTPSTWRCWANPA